MPDLEITCVACNQPFAFSESEQAFYEERGFQQPKRCRECRQSGRRSQRPQGPRPPRRDSGRTPGGGGAGRGAPRGRGGPPPRRAPRQGVSHIGGRLVYTTHCAGCGAETEVPTPVNAGRSAFCPPCFAVRGKAWLEDEA